MTISEQCLVGIAGLRCRKVAGHEDAHDVGGEIRKECMPAPPSDAPAALDAAEVLWGVVANVSGGDWSRQSAEWQEAAARARDLYYKALDIHTNKPTTPPSDTQSAGRDRDVFASQIHAARLLAANGDVADAVAELDKAIATLNAHPSQPPTVDVEMDLRREWWFNHGCSTAALYGDDGEMQCGRHLLDFKRTPIETLRKRVVELRMIAAMEAKSSTVEVEALAEELALACFDMLSLGVAKRMEGYSPAAARVRDLTLQVLNLSPSPTVRDEGRESLSAEDENLWDAEALRSMAAEIEICHPSVTTPGEVIAALRGAADRIERTPRKRSPAAEDRYHSPNCVMSFGHNGPGRNVKDRWFNCKKDPATKDGEER